MREEMREQQKSDPFAQLDATHIANINELTAHVTDDPLGVRINPDDVTLTLEPPHPRRPWDQQPGEPDDRYAQFLVYLTLGQGRSIIRAFQLFSIEKQKADLKISGEAGDLYIPASAPAQWYERSSRWRWEERAQRYDVYALSSLVPQTTKLIFEVISEFATMTLERLRSRDIQPESWNEIQEAVITLASYISPEIIQATVNSASSTLTLDHTDASRVGDGQTG